MTDEGNPLTRWVAGFIWRESIQAIRQQMESTTAAKSNMRPSHKAQGTSYCKSVGEPAHRLQHCHPHLHQTQLHRLREGKESLSKGKYSSIFVCVCVGVVLPIIPPLPQRIWRSSQTFKRKDGIVNLGLKRPTALKRNKANFSSSCVLCLNFLTSSLLLSSL